MRVGRVSIPGSYEDAWVYKDHLFAWSTSGDLLVGSLQNLVDVADVESTDLGTAIALLFVRNDWKASALFKRLTRVTGIHAQLDEVFSHLEGDGLVLTPNEAFDDGTDGLIEGTLLSATVYADQLYFSTTSGFFDSSLDWDRGVPILPEGAHQRLPHRTVSSSIGYGAVNASCEEEGLFTNFDEFGWGSWTNNRGLEQTDDLSYGTSWVGTGLLNYRGRDVRLLEGDTAQVEDAGRRRDSEKKLLVEYSSRRDLTSLVHADLVAWLERNDMDVPAHTRVVGNSGANLVVETESQTLLVQMIGLSTEPAVKSVESLPQAEEAVLSVARLAGGTVLESESSVYLWSESGVTELLALPALRVRTFPNSIRYRDMAVIVTENALHLVGAYAPEVELPRNRQTKRRRGVD